MEVIGDPDRVAALDVRMYEERIERATRAIQTGTHWQQGFHKDTEAALRTSIVTGMADHTALVDCLVAAGVITRRDYLAAQAAAREAAAELLSGRLARRVGREVDLYGPE